MKFSKKILSNGLRLITVPMKDNPTVTVMTLVETGSKYETKAENGISHFLEHMCFKGTEKRPKVIDIAKELDSIGAAYNAFTAQEFTGYFAKADYKHFDKILNVVSDVYLNSTLPANEIEKEKGVIVEEINMYQDLPQRHVQDMFLELLYGDTPVGRNIAGTKETVRSFTRDQLSDYRRKHYVASATIAVVSGNVSEDAAEKAVDNAFSNLSNGAKHGREKVVEAQTSPAIQLMQKDTDQTHLVAGVRTFGIADKRNPALRIMAAVLGGGMSSRLFQRVREEMGAGYYVGAAPEIFADHGFLSVSAGVASGRETEVLAVIIEEFSRLLNDGISAEDLQSAKEFLTGSLYLGLESSDSLADFFGFQELMRRPLRLPDEIVAEIRAVTASDVKVVSKDIFKDTLLNLAAIGKNLPEEKLKGALKFFR